VNFLFWKTDQFLEKRDFYDFITDLKVKENKLLDKDYLERENFLDEAEFNDLYFLYSTIRENLIFSILEFGSGYSTLVQALALYQNKLKWEDSFRLKCNHPNPFKLLTIDASQYFLNISLNRIPDEILTIVEGVASEVEFIEFGGAGGQISNRWVDFPDFIPDLIYIDGPDPEQIKGSIQGFKHGSFGLPMSCDVLSREFFYWTGTTIVLDGRGANAEFLKRNLKRNWSYHQDQKNDRHIFTLEEAPWGYFSRQYLEFKQEIFDQGIPWVESRKSYLSRNSESKGELNAR
jgi:hypothetical protein